jgi:hypothetical protein
VETGTVVGDPSEFQTVPRSTPDSGSKKPLPVRAWEARAWGSPSAAMSSKPTTVACVPRAASARDRPSRSSYPPALHLPNRRCSRARRGPKVCTEAYALLGSSVLDRSCWIVFRRFGHQQCSPCVDNVNSFHQNLASEILLKVGHFGTSPVPRSDSWRRICRLSAQIED